MPEDGKRSSQLECTRLPTGEAVPLNRRRMDLTESHQSIVLKPGTAWLEVVVVDPHRLLHRPTWENSYPAQVMFRTVWTSAGAIVAGGGLKGSGQAVLVAAFKTSADAAAWCSNNICDQFVSPRLTRFRSLFSESSVN
jgi:hypothetical protein